MITYWYKVYDIDIDVHHNVITCTITISGKEWSERYDRREVCRTSNRDVASNKALISDGSSENFSFDQYYKPIVLYIYSLLFLPRIDWKRRMLETNWSYSSLLSSLYVFLWTNNDKNIQMGISIRYDNNNKRISRNINTRR